MEWREYKINTVTAAEDLVADMLYELGINSVEIIDKVPLTEEEVREMYIDIEAELPEDDGSAAIRFYLGMDEDNLSIIEKVKEGLRDLRDFMDIGEGSILETTTKEEDWINNWKEFFKPFFLNDILIKPSWEEIPEGAEYKVMIEIDPKTSFGTGHHETTRLCIEGLEDYMKEGDQVLDLGTGSGILSIIALKLGAKHATGTDIDPICHGSFVENMEMNGILPSQYEIMIGNLIDDENFLETVGRNKYDLVLANILADIIIPMAEAAYETVKPGGYFVTSGIIDFKEEPVKAKLTEVGFDIVEVKHMGEWVSVIAKK